jgi:hypothetical protein
MSGGLIFRAAQILLLCLLAAPAAAELPELPRVYVDTSLVVPTGAAIKVPSGGDLQQALNIAEPGDVIVLEAGSVYPGPFTLPRKTGDGWIAVVSSRVLELAADQRVLPSDAPKMAVLEGGAPSVLQTEPGAHVVGPAPGPRRPALDDQEPAGAQERPPRADPGQSLRSQLGRRAARLLDCAHATQSGGERALVQSRGRDVR